MTAAAKPRRPRALPPPPRMPRAQRLALQRERAARLQRKQADQLLKRLWEQRAALLDPAARNQPMPELRGLICAARAATHQRFDYGGRSFIVRRGLVFSAVLTVSGRHIVSFGGEIFR